MAPITIAELSLDKIRPGPDPEANKKGGFKLTIIGKPGSGKSMLIKALIYNKCRHIPAAVIISGSEEVNAYYQNFIPELFIFSKFSIAVLDKIMERQRYAKRFLPNPWLLVVFDDCMDNTRLFQHPSVVHLFKNGRHYNILAIFANQYVLDFKPEIRTSIDGVFIFREQNKNNRDKLYNNFASVIPDKQLFYGLMDRITVDYRCLYIDNTNGAADWQDCVFWYKAKPAPPFKFGSRSYQEFAAQRGLEEGGVHAV